MDWAEENSWQRSRKWLKAGWLATAALVAVYIGMVEPRQMAREISASRSTGLGAVAGGSILPWRQNALPDSMVGQAMFLQGNSMADEFALKASSADEINAERKLITSSSIDMVVKNPASAAEEIRKLAEANGGFLVNSLANGDSGRYASLAIRVPVAHFTAVKAAIVKQAIRVENDRVEAQDATKQYVDQNAQLRNLRAQEQQYLGILKRAVTVKETLEVSQELNRVRGEIEQKQAEFVTLSKQTETVAISITLKAEAEAQVFGIRWRPLYELKIAARNGLAGVADYLGAMISFAFYLPTILLWLATFVFGAAVAWRVIRRIARLFFGFPRTVLTEKEAS